MTKFPTFTTWSEAPHGGRGVMAQRVGARIVAAVAEASFTGCETDYARVGDTYLAHVPAWLEADPECAYLAERTTVFLREMRGAIPDELAALEAQGLDTGDSPSLQTIVAVASASSVRVWWLGGGLAQLVRRGEVVASAEPHLLRGVPTARWVATKVTDPLNTEPEFAEWQVRPGDHLVVLDALSTRRAELDPLPTTWPAEIDAQVAGAIIRSAILRQNDSRRAQVPVAGAIAVLAW